MNDEIHLKHRDSCDREKRQQMKENREKSRRRLPTNLKWEITFEHFFVVDSFIETRSDTSTIIKDLYFAGAESGSFMIECRRRNSARAERETNIKFELVKVLME